LFKGGRGINPFLACATSVDPDQPAHLCHLIWISSCRILVRNNCSLFD
jgi:hypothetical protein